METILFLAHSEEDGSISRVALETLSAARDIQSQLAGSKLVVGLLGGTVSTAASLIAQCGAQSFVEVSGPDYLPSRYSSDTAAIEAIVRETAATIVLFPATSRLNRSVPGVVQRLGGRIDTHISGFKVAGGVLQVHRWYYRQRMIAALTRTARPWFLSVDSGTFTAYTGQSAAVTTKKCAVKLKDSSQKTTILGFKAPSADAQTIRPDAKLLFVAGVGWTKKQADGQPHTEEAAKLILNFLGKTQASLGSSKSLVDQSSEGQNVFSFMSHLNQVGQTGSTPRHPKGLSTCCHGEEPHAVGWRFINDRRAINLDPNCGWARGKADVLYVADAFKVMEKVNELLKI